MNEADARPTNFIRQIIDEDRFRKTYHGSHALPA